MPGDARPLPAFPKPAAVLAAEARAEKRKAEAGSISAVTDAATLEKKCYKVEGKTCAMLLVRGGAGAASGEEGLASLAKKYSRDGFVFAAIDSDDAALTDLVLGLGGEMAMGSQSLAVVKTGKRPRVAAVTGGATDFESLLDRSVSGRRCGREFYQRWLTRWLAGSLARKHILLTSVGTFSSGFSTLHVPLFHLPS